MPMKLPLKDRSTTFLRCIPAVLLLCNAFLGYYLLLTFFLFFPCGGGVWILQDRQRLMDMLTYPKVEEAIKRRVEMKAKTYGQEVTVDLAEDEAEPVYKIVPSLVADLYGDWIMPLTKEVQVEYLLRRLD
jgi:hypothetical protein